MMKPCQQKRARSAMPQTISGVLSKTLRRSVALSLACFLLLNLAAIARADERYRDQVESNRLAQLPAAADWLLPEPLAELEALLATAPAVETATAQAERIGTALWQSVRNNVQLRRVFDDRPLYWTRLALQARLQQHAREQGWSPTTQEQLWLALEHASRGISSVAYDEAPERVFVTGFDPFRLDQTITQSNPSGLAALALDGRQWQIGSRWIRIEAVLIPVRFADFDAGMIEAVLTPQMTDPQLQLLVTISMGRSGFDLERFPGRRRSADAPDNRQHKTGGTPQQPVLPRLGERALAGPEFVEFSLPVARMLRVQRPFPVTDNGEVTTKAGVIRARSLADLRYHTAVSGSGGGYLSNEISYRSLLLRDALRPSLPVGHIHTPRVQGFDPVQAQQIVEQIEALLQAALRSP